MVELRISINLLNGYKMSYSLNRARCRRIGMVNGGLAAINRASHLCDPGSTMASGPMWAEIQSISIGLSQGFSPGSPVFFPHQNRLSVAYIRLLADILDRDNLWYPSLLLNYMNKVVITVFFFLANVLYITCAIHVLVNMHIKRFRR